MLKPFDLQEALICTARDLGNLHGKRGARAPPQLCAVLGSVPCGGGGPGSSLALTLFRKCLITFLAFSVYIDLVGLYTEKQTTPQVFGLCPVSMAYLI